MSSRLIAQSHIYHNSNILVHTHIDNRIVDYCIRKRLPWNSCFVRKVCKEGEYYEDMMRYLRKNLAVCCLDFFLTYFLNNCQSGCKDFYQIAELMNKFRKDFFTVVLLFTLPSAKHNYFIESIFRYMFPPIYVIVFLRLAFFHVFIKKLQYCYS